MRLRTALGLTSTIVVVKAVLIATVWRRWCTLAQLCPPATERHAEVVVLTFVLAAAVIAVAVSIRRTYRQRISKGKR
jgi:hypothetical protein